MKKRISFHWMLPLFALTLLMCSSPTPPGNDSGSPQSFFADPPSADSVPAPFAPGLVSTGLFTRDLAISPDGKEMYFSIAVGSYSYATILLTERSDEGWTTPEIVSFSGGPGVMDLEPAFSADGQQLFFLSTRPDGDEEAGDQDIWVVDRRAEGWSEPRNLGAPVNTDGGEFFPSLTRDGTLYFTRNEKGSRLSQVYRSRFVGGQYQEPELLPAQVNCGQDRFNAFVSQGEEYLIVPSMGMADAFDGVDYYISFRDSADRWSEPLNLGAAVNRDNARGWSPHVSADGLTFYFMASRTDSIAAQDWNYGFLKELHTRPGNGNPTMYHMDAGFINRLREKAVFSE